MKASKAADYSGETLLILFILTYCLGVARIAHRKLQPFSTTSARYVTIMRTTSLVVVEHSV